MPLIKGIEVSKSITMPLPVFRKRLGGYTRKDLLNVSLNLLNKVKFFHDRGVLLGDVNANNFILNPETREVFFIDCDSYQIDKHLCEVGTVEYTPSELQGKDFRETPRTIYNELFSLAVLIFTILMPGQKPYASKGGEDIVKNIKDGNFPYPLGLDYDYKEPRGRWDLIWKEFDYRLKEAFYNTFKLGKRVEVSKWIEILENSIKIIDENNNFVFPEDSERLVIDGALNMLGRAAKGNMRTTVLKNLIEKKDKVAILEISTRAVKLLIRNNLEQKEFSFDDFHLKNGGFREGKLTKTGKGLKSNMYMDMKYFEARVSPAIEEFLKIAVSTHKVKYIYCVATAAIRSAHNKDEILKYIKNKHKINCRILSKEEEAFITAKAFRYSGYNKENGRKILENHENKNIAFIDQGGGSTEFVVFNNMDKKPIYTKSLNLGTTTLENSLFVNSNYNTSLERAFEELDKEIEKRLRVLFREVNIGKLDSCVGVGTAITSASNKKGNKNQHCFNMRIDIMEMNLNATRKDLFEKYGTVGNLKKEWENNENKIDSKITEALGLKAYIEILKYFNLDNLVISGTGLWYGVFYKAYEEIVVHRDHLAG
jgi:serine/threonine protein kinase